MSGLTDSQGLPNILCFSSTDWHGKWGSRQQVMMRFAARGSRVLFIEQLAGLEPFWKYPDLRQRRWQRWHKGVQEIKPNLWLWAPPPLLPGRYYSATIARLNAALVRHWLAPHLQCLEITNPILWLYQPEHAPLIEHFMERLVVYHCIDEFTVGTRGRKRQIITDLETRLLCRADVVFANSTLIYENKRRVNQSTYRIPSGADLAHFAQVADPATEVHPDVADLPHPVLAFIGNVNEKIDVATLAAVAKARPRWSIVLIGQAYPESTDLRPIQGLANIHWLGKRPFETLPSLLRGADVCLLPYVQGEATRYRSPLKLYEYLAAGKPVVSTDHPEAREMDNVVYLATTPETFLECIDLALSENNQERCQQRVTTVQQHSWGRRVDKMERILREHLER